MTLQLFGYKHSVYSWIARLALQEKGVLFEWQEVNPFEDEPSDSYLKLHPFNRVPTLVHDGFHLYETGAITRYIDEQFEGPQLQPADPQLRATQNQLISIADNYVYWPLVRQVFSHRVFRSKFGLETDEEEVVVGLDAARTVLDAINAITGGKPYFVHGAISLVDIHLFPMVTYFAAAKEGMEMLKGYDVLLKWHKAMSARPAAVKTRPEIIRLNTIRTI